MANDLNDDGAIHVPGTVHLVDLLGTMSERHAESGQKDIVLIPAPSSDPDDPLNWSPQRKTLSTVCMCVYTLMVGIASAAIYSVLVPISEDTGLSLDDLNQGTGLVEKSFLREKKLADSSQLHVPIFWLGLSDMATTGSAVWKTTRVPVVYSGNARHPDMGTTYQDERSVDRKQDCARVCRRTNRESV